MRFEPEPWTGQDVVVWVKMMAWDLSSNYSSELMRMDLAAQVGAKRMADLVPPFPAERPDHSGQGERRRCRDPERVAPQQ